jgi:hypothetical protein
MGYLLKEKCYETKQEFINAVAQNCLSGGSGSGALSTYFTTCTANTDNVTVQAYLLSNGTAQIAWTYTPQLISCDAQPITNADVVQLSWLVVSVWVVAWGIKKMMEVLRK